MPQTVSVSRLQDQVAQKQRFAERNPLYRLGHVSFTVDSTDVAFKLELARLLPLCRVEPQTVCKLAADDFRGLLARVLELHEGYAWLSAACLLSPQGHKVLISGQSSAGKSTTALALALQYGWKALSEDLTCIDLQRNKIIAFATPFSLKTGTLEMLADSISSVPETLVFGEWVPMSDMHVEGEFDTNLDLILYFDTARKGEPIQQIACSPGEYVRLLLPCSNLLHDECGPQKLAEYAAASACYRVTGGSLLERISLIRDMTTGGASL